MAKKGQPSRASEEQRAALLGGGVLALVFGLFAWLKRKTIKSALVQQQAEREQAVEAAKPRHQLDEVNFGGIVLTGGALVAMILLAVLGAGALFTIFADNRNQPITPVSPLAQTAQIPPEPRSQSDLRPNLQSLRATEDATLSSYGWVDRQNNVVHIPIDRAMDVLVQQGLPTSPPQPLATPVSQPTASN